MENWLGWMIGGNGSYVEHHGQVLMHQLISKEDAAKIVDWLTERHLPFIWRVITASLPVLIFGSGRVRHLRLTRIQKGQSAESVESKEPEDFIHGLKYGGELYRDDLNKVSFVLESYQDHLDSKEAFPQLEAHTWGGRGETALFGDLGVKDINKAHAIDVLLEHLGAKRSDTIAFGDAKIDIPMLEYCEIGVAMGNGGPEILAMADLVTDDVEADGLYKAFDKLGLLQ